MTTLDKKLHKIITDLLPEILDLVIGCKVVVDGSIFSDKKSDIRDTIFSELDDGFITNNTPAFYPLLKKEWIKEIIGTPIGLPEVLRAIFIRKTKPNSKIPTYFNCCNDGSFYSVEYTYPDGNHCVVEHKSLCQWDLTKDLFSQTEETKQFLLDILS